MNIFVSHKSAREYWSTNERTPNKGSYSLPQAGPTPTPNQIERLRLWRFGIQGTPIHITVHNESNKHAQSGVVRHALSTRLPPRSFIKLMSGVYISTPESCFLQTAAELSIIELVEFACELCGYYAIYPFNREFSNVHPRTTIKMLQAYLERASGCPGIKKARRAARYAQDKSASPIETKLFMMLCLPPLLGGYGLPRPEMNYPIKIKRASYPSNQTLYCDLCWPTYSMALEYDSNQFHTGTQKINHDSKRRALIESTGIHVLSVTSQQIYDASAFDNLAHVIAQELGYRIRDYTGKALERHWKLRQELLS